MIFAEGVLIGAWMIVWLTLGFALKLLLRGTWASTSLGVM